MKWFVFHLFVKSYFKWGLKSFVYLFFGKAYKIGGFLFLVN
ncbi:hypothetical protein DFO77_110114 [Marinilabilia salmonicolor]|jgi:hypothetical protein|uniref:Uncharacterized protein n=1 Tax=Marinilabilia salmonicolor TaxID=989 RepID=A0A2T0XEQ1_9BACT|nr:hypothetical protein BY457_112108 [Marinilabilia salmonicolor]RCW35347.1 hypothetical protein DFO77_110114 [Marinilabilia salmonicolor]